MDWIGHIETRRGLVRTTHDLESFMRPWQLPEFATQEQTGRLFDVASLVNKSRPTLQVTKFKTFLTTFLQALVVVARSSSIKDQCQCLKFTPAISGKAFGKR